MFTRILQNKRCFLEIKKKLPQIFKEFNDKLPTPKPGNSKPNIYVPAQTKALQDVPFQYSNQKKPQIVKCPNSNMPTNNTHPIDWLINGCLKYDKRHMWSKDCLSFRSTWGHNRFLVGFVFSCSVFSFFMLCLVYCCVSRITILKSLFFMLHVCLSCTHDKFAVSESNEFWVIFSKAHTKIVCD